MNGFIQLALKEAWKAAGSPHDLEIPRVPPHTPSVPSKWPLASTEYKNAMGASDPLDPYTINSTSKLPFLFFGGNEGL